MLGNYTNQMREQNSSQNNDGELEGQQVNRKQQ